MGDRLDASLITPWIPREVREFLARTDGAVSQRSGVLGVGKPGKVGVLEATFKVDQASGRTGLAKRFVKASASGGGTCEFSTEVSMIVVGIQRRIQGVVRREVTDNVGQ